MNKIAWWFSPTIAVSGVHTTVGTVIFALIAIPAIGLNWWIDSLAGSVDRYIILVLTGLEYLLFSADALLFVIHIVRSALKASREIWAQQ